MGFDKEYQRYLRGECMNYNQSLISALGEMEKGGMMKLTKSKVEELEEILNAPVYIDKTGQALFNPGGNHEDIEGWILVPDEKMNEVQKEKEV